MAWLKEHEKHTNERGYNSWGVVTINGPLGDVQLSVCEDCPEQRAFCLHTYCSWVDNMTRLVCHLCEADCT